MFCIWGVEWEDLFCLGARHYQAVSPSTALFVELLFDVLEDSHSPYEAWQPMISFGSRNIRPPPGRQCLKRDENQLNTERIEKTQVVYKEIEQKLQAIRGASRGKMRAVLSPEQSAISEKMKAEYGKTPEPVKEMK